MTSARSPSKGGAESERRRLLVVDDDPVSLELALDIVSELGYSGQGAGTAAEFLAAMERERFDAVLLDWNMPDLSGLEAARIYRKAERSRGDGLRTPLIAVTGNGDEESRKECLAAGMDDYLPKPYEIDELEAALARWVTREQE